MKWLITLSLILYAFAVPLQPVQADSSTAPNFGPLASLVGEWQGKDPEGKPMTASYQWTGSGTTSGRNDDEGGETDDDDDVPCRQNRPDADSLL